MQGVKWNCAACKTAQEKKSLKAYVQKWMGGLQVVKGPSFGLSDTHKVSSFIWARGCKHMANMLLAAWLRSVIMMGKKILYGSFQVDNKGAKLCVRRRLLDHETFALQNSCIRRMWCRNVRSEVHLLKLSVKRLCAVQRPTNALLTHVHSASHGCCWPTSNKQGALKGHRVYTNSLLFGTHSSGCEYLQPWAEWLHDRYCFWSIDIKHPILTLQVCCACTIQIFFWVIRPFSLIFFFCSGWKTLTFSYFSLAPTSCFKCQTCACLCFCSLMSYNRSGSILVFGSCCQLALYPSKLPW